MTTSTGTLTVEMLPARSGDALWVSYGDTRDRHVLVDCGFPDGVPALVERIEASRRVELLIVTHIDGDHIGGAIPLLDEADSAARIADVWFNGWKQLRGFLGYRQADRFSQRLDRDDRPFRWNGGARGDDPPEAIVASPSGFPVVELDGGMTLTVLSPTAVELRDLARRWPEALREFEPRTPMLGRRERPAPVPDPSRLDLDGLARRAPTRDRSPTNASSIAVLAEYGDRAVLLTGDAHADVLATSIRALQVSRRRPGERLRLDALKVSHHGSANATTRDLLDLIDCKNYLISTDGSGGHYHPDRAAIARLITWGGPAPTLVFNYRTEFTELWADPGLQERHGYSTVYPRPGAHGVAIVL